MAGVKSDMKIVLKLLMGVLSVIGVVVACLIVVFFLHKNGYLGHSEFYDLLDVNSDGKLSYDEWMKYYSLPMHKHPIENCMRVDFYYADCNQNDELTWKEYHNFRFRNKRCVSSAVPTFQQWLESNPESTEPTKSSKHALSTSTMARAQSKAYQHYFSILQARENELMKKYGIEWNSF